MFFEILFVGIFDEIVFVVKLEFGFIDSVSLYVEKAFAFIHQFVVPGF